MLDFQNSLQAIDFNVRIRPLYDESGNELPRDLGRAVQREDTDEIIAVCGPNFQPVQHSDVVNPLLEWLDEQGYDLHFREADRHNLHDMAGKSGAFVSSAVTDRGAVMRTNIVLGDFIEPTGHSSFLPTGPDLNFFRISILNSHNSKFAVWANTDYLRLVCMNGCARPHFSTGTYGKHTANFSVEGMTAKITAAMDMMQTDADEFGLWARTPITPKQAEYMLQRTIARLPKMPNGDDNASKSLINKILGYFQTEEQTVWGLYNACTYWQTHGDLKKNSDELTARVNRESRVSSMLRSREWKALVSA